MRVKRKLWKWIDAHEKELGIGRPYLDRDPPHVGPIDGKEYADKRGRAKAQAAGMATNKRHRVGCARQSRQDEKRKSGKSLSV